MSLAEFSDANLEDSLVRHRQVLESVLKRLKRDVRLHDAVQRYLLIENKLRAIADLEPDIAELVIQTANEIVSNSVCITVIESEQQRRKMN